MAVPSLNDCLLPILEVLSDGNEWRPINLRKTVAERLSLSVEDLSDKRSSRDTWYQHHMHWATQHLSRADLVTRLRKGVWRISPAGRQLLENPPSSLDLDFLFALPAYKNWRANRNRTNGGPEPDPEPEKSAEDVVKIAFEHLEAELQADLLLQLHRSSPGFFEKVVVDLLIAMKYGGGDPDMGNVTGQTGDGGIDGVINQDPLGLDKVYVQAKKYGEGRTVGEGEIRNFVGAIDVVNASKGVFVTTARFSNKAQEYMERSSKRIELINGQKLTGLMVRYGVGVRTRETLLLQRIDEEYFDR